MKAYLALISAAALSLAARNKKPPNRRLLPPKLLLRLPPVRLPKQRLLPLLLPPTLRLLLRSLLKWLPNAAR